jgi:predicted ATP-grasp superfamily ATP-dependent carboligase/alpha-beta hydrolase superfamily lysophospholipase
MRPTPDGSAFYLDFDGTAGHAVLHEPRKSPRDTAVLMVAPFGWDDVSSYRSRRTWTISLAEDGFPTMRFDLPGTGDSAGTAEEPELVEKWIRAIGTAAGELRAVTGCTSVTAIGLNLGGLLACAASARGAPIDELVLWATPSRGRAVIRELRAFAQLLVATDPDAPPLPDGAVSINGYLMAGDTVAAVNHLDVRTNARPSVRRALLLGRDALPVDDALHAALLEGGATISVASGEGYGVLMDQPQESQPSKSVMIAVRNWLGPDTSTDVVRAPTELRTTATVRAPDGTEVRERLIELATPTALLSGVLTEPVGEPATLCALLLNAGAVRRTGPSHLWVDTARRWATRGVATVRLDLAGLGDSTGDVRYPLEDLGLYEGEFGVQVSSALDGLVGLGLPPRFVLMGLCSGAYWSFQTAQRDPRVAAVVMLNPKALIIDPFVEALRTARHLRDRTSWRRIFRGNVSKAGAKSAALAAVHAIGGAPSHLRATRRAREGRDELVLGFDRLHDNGQRAVLLFSAGESLRTELSRHGRLDQFDRWPNLDLHLLDGSVETHTLQPPRVQAQVEVIIDQALDDFLSRQEVESPLVGKSTSKSNSRVDVLVLDADERQSLVAVRSLGRAGLVVAAVATKDGAPAFRSRWCAVRDIVPDPADDPGAFIDAVSGFAQSHSPRAIITAHDGSIEALRAHRAVVEKSARVALGSEPALEIAVSKERTLAVATGLGIRVPRGEVVSSPAELKSMVAELGLPVVVKPDHSWHQHGQSGVRIAPSAAMTARAALAIADEVWRVGGTVILQELLSGDREAISVLRADGRIWARFAQMADRTFPPLGGSSVTRTSIELPTDATDAAEQLIDACGLDGYSEIEFRRDAAGRPVLMEINPRLSASVEVAVRSGVDFPWLVYAWTSGERLAAVGPYRVGVRMRWLGGDIRRLRSALATPDQPDVDRRRTEVSRFMLDFLRRSSYDYVSRGDLGPAASALASASRRAGPEVITRVRTRPPPRASAQDEPF